MFDWWNAIDSVAKANGWAQVLTIVFLVLTAASGLFSFTSSRRILALKDMAAQGIVAPAAQAPALPKAAKAPAQPAAEVEPPKAVVPPAKQAAPAQELPQAAAAAHPAAPVAAPAENQRFLTKAQKDKLVSLLTGRPKGQVSVTYMLNDLEAQTYFNELVNVLDATGWKIVKTAPASLASAPKGLHFQIKSPDQEPENAKYLIHSFIEVGVKPSTELNKAVPDGTLLLIVGHKP